MEPTDPLPFPPSIPESEPLPFPRPNDLSKILDAYTKAADTGCNFLNLTENKTNLFDAIRNHKWLETLTTIQLNRMLGIVETSFRNADLRHMDAKERITDMMRLKELTNNHYAFQQQQEALERQQRAERELALYLERKRATQHRRLLPGVVGGLLEAAKPDKKRKKKKKGKSRRHSSSSPSPSSSSSSSSSGSESEGSSKKRKRHRKKSKREVTPNNAAAVVKEDALAGNGSQAVRVMS
jgi:hypothetical protein